jgi:hypothetical protein
MIQPLLKLSGVNLRINVTISGLLARIFPLPRHTSLPSRATGTPSQRHINDQFAREFLVEKECLCLCHRIQCKTASKQGLDVTALNQAH